MATAVRPADPTQRLSRVLIVDDSVVARTVIARAIESSGQFAVAGQAGSVDAALRFLRSEQVDLVLLDLAMPGQDGLTGLPDLLAVARGAQIIVVSSAAEDGAAITARALTLGAADTLEKPSAADMASGFARTLIDRMTRLRGGRDLREVRPGTRPKARAAAPREGGDAGEFDIVVIGASTGGIHALSAVLGALPVGFTCPILVTQHLPSAFMPYFASQLATSAGRPCVVAHDHMRLCPGHIVVAPGDAHIRCVALGDGKGSLRLGRERVASGCLPSVDPMFASAADVFGARVLAIVLSGMGRDGTDGARRVREAGGCILVQDEASSVVWGMPGSIAALGLADAVLAPAQIGRLMAAGRRA